MANRTPPNERLGHLVHLDRRLHARIDALFFKRVLQSQRVDDGRQHAHVIGRDAVHVLGLLGHAAEKIPATDHDRNLHTQLVHIGHFRRDLMNPRLVDAEALVGRQRLAGEFEQNAFENRGCHC